MMKIEISENNLTFKYKMILMKWREHLQDGHRPPVANQWLWIYNITDCNVLQGVKMGVAITEMLIVACASMLEGSKIQDFAY